MTQPNDTAGRWNSITPYRLLLLESKYPIKVIHFFDIVMESGLCFFFSINIIFLSYSKQTYVVESFPKLHFTNAQLIIDR